MTTVPAVLYQTLQEEPDRLALILQSPDGDQAITYADLISGALGYANSLECAGVRRNEPVILLLQHGRPLIEAFFGTILHGSIPTIMPFLTEKLSPERYRQSLVALIEITKPVVIITYPDFADEVTRVRKEGDSVRCVLLWTEVEPAADLSWETLGGMDSEPEDIVLLQHSSGTTGLQKGVALSHQSVLCQLKAYGKSINMTRDDIVVSWLPLYHDMGLIAGFILPILLRSKLVLMSPFDWIRAPYRLLSAISQYHGTLSWLPNFAYNFMARKVRDRDLENVDLSSWRAVINCSEPMRWKSQEDFYNRFSIYGLKRQALATCYAMAENVFAVTQGGIESPVVVDEIDRRSLLEDQIAVPAKEADKAIKMLSAGQPIDGTSVRVLGVDGKDLPDRHVGEIGLQGDCLLSGYYNRDDLTEKTFIDDWYITGDLGYLVDGELFVTGRKKELIIVGGKNVFPQDLEELAMDVEGVHPGRVVAFGLFNEDIGTEEIGVIAEVDVAENDTRVKIAREIRDQISRGTDVTARYVLTVDRGWLIKTSSGKIARGANRDKYLQESA
ncbi:MAG: AMP-binding protein [Anaerolineales bacterium]|jgi:fatty-acyl-CoA synthase|nr:AMP-binding protein [Anaerolineales bacterium]